MASARLEPFLLDPEWIQAFLAAEKRQWCSLDTSRFKGVRDPLKRFKAPCCNTRQYEVNTATFSSFLQT